jgi:hypothetical protein
MGDWRRSMGGGRWFIIQSGEHAGRWHLAGWFLSAFSVLGWVREPDKLVSYGTCPRCGAMVLTDDTPGNGDFSWAHEDWHHETDYPHDLGRAMTTAEYRLLADRERQLQRGPF